MVYIIVGVIVIWLIWQLIKLIAKGVVFLSKGIGIILLVGAGVGLIVGVFYGIKNYMSSVNENIQKNALRYIMHVITIFFLGFIIVGTFYLISATDIFREDTENTSMVIPEEIYTEQIVVSDGLNVREGPSIETNVKFVVYRNQIVNVSNTDKLGDWVKIQYDGNEGYVNQTYLREVE